MHFHRNDPQWYKDAVIYELHVRAFRDTNEDGIGDFPGLIEKLDYLKDLGVTALWLLPFYPSPLKDDGYDIADYMGIHPNYGTLEDFKRFIDEAHKRDLRVITELVVNHTSDQHPWFQAARRAPWGSPEHSRYVWTKDNTELAETRIIFCDTEVSNWTWDEEAQAYYWHRFYSHQPDLNHNNPEVVKEVSEILKYWLDMGVDGLRLDAVPYLCVREGTNNENLPETHEAIKQLRAAVDEHFDDRMLLAEANQWPSDVVEYFGDGDECHMAYHFPVMPRIFMALRQEDRTPIVEIMKQTPDIPDSCQWALFLRNHDELTLEMVTDEERDYMYREYANDQRMRINVGIRRRLAPLVENNRRAIEMLNSLLLSFPGTPILYYGDEIGMGDNIYLGDRNGVRTPMQWSIDRNAGFSHADPASLYLPTIMDPVYGYQGLNVEAQQKQRSSLLYFMKRIIGVRQQFKAFGRGSMEFLLPRNKRVMAYIRRYKDEVILCVVNFSRYVQSVELDLSRFKDYVPMELIGHSEFPTIGDSPYFFSLGPHSFYWFKLEPKPAPIRLLNQQQRQSTLNLPILSLKGDWGTLWESSLQAQLEQDVLPEYLRRQAWFRQQEKRIEHVSLSDWAKVGANTYLAFLTLRYEEGIQENLCLPLRLADVKSASILLQQAPDSVLAYLRLTGDGSPDEQAILYDALYDESACKTLRTAIEEGRQFKTAQGGVLKGRSFQQGKASQRNERSPQTSGSTLRLEKLATAEVYDGQDILRLFHYPEPAPSPDIEIRQFLTEKNRFPQVMKVLAALEYLPDGSNPDRTVAIIQDLVPSQYDTAEIALSKQLADFVTLWQSDASDKQTLLTQLPTISAMSVSELIDFEIPSEYRDLLKSTVEAFEHLGQQTARMHQALASETDPGEGPTAYAAFTPEPVPSSYLEGHAEKGKRLLQETFELLNERQPGIDEALEERRQRLLACSGLMSDIFTRLTKEGLEHLGIRRHGFYTLDKLLMVGNDFICHDLGGETEKPLPIRRRKGTVLIDIAQMLQSINQLAYVGFVSARADHNRTHTAEHSDNQYSVVSIQSAVKTWCRWARIAFLGTYLKSMQPSDLLPQESKSTEALLLALRVQMSLKAMNRALVNDEMERSDWLVNDILDQITE